MVLWVDENQQANVSLLDKNEVPWENILKGKILDREEALNYPYKEEIFHITDHIFWEDKEIINFLFPKN